MKIKLFLSMLFAVCVILLVACAGEQSQGIQNLEPVEYTVEMTEFAFNPNVLQAKVGQEVTIELVNIGALEHEFMAGRNVRITNNRPDGFEQDLFEAADASPVVIGGQKVSEEMDGHGSTHEGFMVIVPNDSEKATVTFIAKKEMIGEWEIGCFSQQGVHYDAGMKGKLIVTE